MALSGGGDGSEDMDVDMLLGGDAGAETLMGRPRSPTPALVPPFLPSAPAPAVAAPDVAAVGGERGVALPVARRWRDDRS